MTRPIQWRTFMFGTFHCSNLNGIFCMLNIPIKRLEYRRLLRNFMFQLAATLVAFTKNYQIWQTKFKTGQIFIFRGSKASRSALMLSWGVLWSSRVMSMHRLVIRWWRICDRREGPGSACPMAEAFTPALLLPLSCLDFSSWENLSTIRTSTPSEQH